LDQIGTLFHFEDAFLFHPSLYKGREDVKQGDETNVKQHVKQSKCLHTLGLV
jgi:hypothetical protein